MPDLDTNIPPQPPTDEVPDQPNPDDVEAELAAIAGEDGATGEAVEEERIPGRRYHVREDDYEYETVWKLLVGRGVSILDIQAAEKSYRTANSLEEDYDLDGLDLLVAVGSGIADETSGKTKPLVTNDDIEMILGRLNAPSKEESKKELDELDPRPRPAYDADDEERNQDTREFLAFFTDTFREDEEVLTALAKVLDTSRNTTFIEEFNLDIYLPEGPRMEGQGRALAPEDIVRALSKPERPGMGSALGERLAGVGARTQAAYDRGGEDAAEAAELIDHVIQIVRKEAFQVQGKVSNAELQKRLKDRFMEQLEADRTLDRRLKDRFRAQLEADEKTRTWLKDRFMAEARYIEEEFGGERPPTDEAWIRSLPREPDSDRLKDRFRAEREAEPDMSGLPLSRVAEVGGRVGEVASKMAGVFGGIESTYEPTPEVTNERMIQEGAGDTSVLENNVADEALRAYRSGRYAASGDNPLRDPKGILTPIQKRNHSTVLDTKVIDPGEFDAQIIKNPATLYMMDDLALGKNDETQLAARGLTPGSPAYNRVVSDMQIAATEEAANMLFTLTVPPEAPVRYFEDWEQPAKAPKPHNEFFAQVPESAYTGLFKNTPRKFEIKEGEWAGEEVESPMGADTNAIQANTENFFSTYQNRAQELGKKLDNRYGTAMDAGKMWTQLSVEDRKEVQFAAYLEGKYGDDGGFFTAQQGQPTLDPFRIMNGDANDQTAYEFWLEQVTASAFTAARGLSQTPGQIIRNIIDQNKAELEDYWGATAAQVGQVINVNLDDPNAIISQARIAGRALMGENPSPEDYRALVGIIHQGQRAEQIRAARLEAEAEARSSKELNDYRRRQFNLIGEQMDSGTFNSFDDPMSGTNFPGLQPTTQERVDRLNGLASADPEGLLGQRPSGGGGGSGGLPSSAEPFQGTSGTGEVINENVDFNEAAAMEEYFRQNSGQKIDANTMLGFFGDIESLLRSPIQGA